MLEVITAPGSVAFVSAIVLMLLIGVVQVLGIGGDWAELAPDIDADISFDALDWLGIGRVPILVSLILYLAGFGVLGLLLQQSAHDIAGGMLSGWIAVPVAALLAIPVSALAARGVARVLPRDHSTAVSLETLVGATAQIVIGRATAGSPARARTQDAHGQVHYVMVEPDGSGQQFEEGERVLLIRREGDGFRAISWGDHRLPRLEG
ncbi:YqiJ family protein [Sphingomonas pituitosa]|uniref:YqiJ family protein n=1 Tax=Sphingomonas pituitosa TaxID=99597 RepID=UPI000A41A77A|nr:YqiJ family protein [Sphingomonas pituitosa]